jgi:glycosyltransferase involved in cell wall biosynthesis
MPKVSIVMPHFNHGQFVGRAIDSVLPQSFADFELLVTDDASTDDSLEVIRSYRDPRIKIAVLAKNSGTYTAMNEAVARSSGEYLCSLSADDCLAPGSLEHRVRFLDENPQIALVHGPGLVVDEHDRHLYTTAALPAWDRFQYLRFIFLHHNPIFGPSIMYRRVCARKEVVIDFDPRYCIAGDLDLYVRNLCRGHEFRSIAQVTAAFRQHSSGLNTSGNNRRSNIHHNFEYPFVLRHYCDLPEADIRRIFAAEFAALPGADAQPALVAMARVAMSLHDHKAKRIFGACLLRECMGRYSFEPEAFRAYFRMIEKLDPLKLSDAPLQAE